MFLRGFILSYLKILNAGKSQAQDSRKCNKQFEKYSHFLRVSPFLIWIKWIQRMSAILSSVNTDTFW